MGSFYRTPLIVTNVLLAAGLIILWIVFAPSKLGGQIEYVMVKGISMQPVLYEGDLVIVRKAPLYQIGDIVSYKDPTIGAFIIHRIIAEAQDFFITKGDNNSWIDASHPTEDQIVGKLWIHLPKTSSVIEWVRTPVNLALITGFLGGLYMVGLIKKKKNNKNHNNSSFKWTFEYSLYSLAAAGLVFLGLSIFAFIQPLKRIGDSIKYEQTGVFSYSAAGTPGVYDSGSVSSGEPVFTRLTCALNLDFLGFIYTLNGEPIENVAGKQQFYAKVLDQQSGWQRTFPLSQEAVFSGTSYKNTTTLDLCQVEALVSSMETETGVHLSPSYQLIIVSRISANGNIAGGDFNYVFEPKLTFKFDSLHFYVENDATQPDPMKTIKTGAIINSSQVDNSFQLFQLKISILAVRIIAVVGLLFSLGGLVFMGRNFFRATKSSPEMLIRLRFGSIMIDVYDQRLKELKPVIDVAKIDDLAMLAERHNAMIMHLVDDHAHFYLVQIEGTTYRYVTGKNRNNEMD
jgi:signal peptidase I